MSDDSFPALTSATSTSNGYGPIGSGSSTSAAAILQAQHSATASSAMEDPFPVLRDAPTQSTSTKKNGTPKTPDLGSESAFPSLAPSKVQATPGSSRAITPEPNAAAPAWGPAIRTGAFNTANAFPFVQTFAIPTNSIEVKPSTAIGRGGGRREEEPKNLSDVMKLIIKKSNGTVTIESSKSTSSGLTTFAVRGKSEGAVVRARKELVVRVAKKVTQTLTVPVADLSHIIGLKGRTLKGITDATGAKIDIPPRPTNVSEDENATITITISGDVEGVKSAKEKIGAIVAERNSKGVEKVSDIPVEYYPFLKRDLPEKIKRLFPDEETVEDLKVDIPDWRALLVGRWSVTDASGEDVAPTKERDASIVISGDKVKIAKVVEALHEDYDTLKRKTTTLNFAIAKRQHRFLIGATGEEILATTGCTIQVPPQDDPSMNVTIRGPQESLPTGLQKVMEKANALLVDSVDLESAYKDKEWSKRWLRYVRIKGKLKALQEKHSVQIYASSATIDIVAKQQSPLDAARAELVALIKSLSPDHFVAVSIEPLVHKHLIGKGGVRIRNFQEKKKVEALFPSEKEREVVDPSQVLLIFVGAGSPKESLEEVKTELEEAAKREADIKTEIITVAPKLHKFIVGPGGTTLNAIIGEEKNVIVKLPSIGDKANGSSEGLKEDQISIRGKSSDITRVKEALLKLAAEAKESEAINSYTQQFEIDAKFVPHVVGKAGATINKLKEDLGVRIDFTDVAPAEGEKRKRKAKAEVLIKGRKENVEEAKKRINSLVERMAEEVTLTIPMPPPESNIERGTLIGKGGVLLKRLETTYEVRINFPSKDGEEGDDRSHPNEITIRGTKKGAESAKKELVDLIEYEKDQRHFESFTVPDRAIPRILGRAGANIEQIKDDTGATIDVDKVSESPGISKITVRGTITAVSKAKAAIKAISKEVESESTIEMIIDRSLQPSLIGARGQNLRDLIIRSGGPEDVKAQTALVKFPRPGDSNPVTILRGKTELIEKIKAEIEKEIDALKNRVIFGVTLPKPSHPGLIGRGGSGLQELQKKHNVNIVMPGWKTHESVGEVVNKEELGTVDENELIKIVGSKPACEAAAKEIKSKVRPQQQRNAHSKTVQVPLQYHHRIRQRFFREIIPSGVRIDHGGPVPPPLQHRAPTKDNGLSAKAAAARIDQDEEEEEAALDGFEWTVSSLDDADASKNVPWIIQTGDEALVAKTEKLIEEAIEKAKKDGHIAYLVVPQNYMGLVIGKGGSGLDKLRANDVQVDVVGNRNSNTLSLIGSEENLERAHQQVLEMAQNSKRDKPGRRS